MSSKLARRTLARKGGHIRKVSEKKQSFDAEFALIRPVVFERDGGRCVVCNAQGVQVHHIRPRSVGGNNALDNLMLVCVSCHWRCHNEPKWSIENGFLK